MNQTAPKNDQAVNSNKDDLFLIDGSGFIFRAYFAMAYSGRGNMTNPDGVPVSAVFGYTNMLLKMLRDYHAPNIVVVFDAARANFERPSIGRGRRERLRPASREHRGHSPRQQ